MRAQKLSILAMVLVSLVPLYYLNRWLIRVLVPKRSFARFLAYMLISLGIVFLYTFLLTTVILKLFPPAKR